MNKLLSLLLVATIAIAAIPYARGLGYSSSAGLFVLLHSPGTGESEA